MKGKLNFRGSMATPLDVASFSLLGAVAVLGANGVPTPVRFLAGLAAGLRLLSWLVELGVELYNIFYAKSPWNER